MHQLEIGEWTLDLNQNLLQRRDTHIHLEQKPLLLLLFLMAHSGQVINKERLLKTIWRGRVVSEEVISVAVSQLRKALADKVRSPLYIKTVPGSGYQFIFQLKRDAQHHAQQYLTKIFQGNSDQLNFQTTPETPQESFLSSLSRIPANAVIAALVIQVFTIALTVMITLRFSQV